LKFKIHYGEAIMPLVEIKIYIVVLSILKRERDFATVSDRLSCTAWTFPIVQSSRTYHEHFCGSLGIQTAINVHGTVNGCHAERPVTFQPERSNALERIIGNFNGTVSFQNRKNSCRILDQTRLNSSINQRF
jgi:hypothetical protein